MYLPNLISTELVKKYESGACCDQGVRVIFILDHPLKLWKLSETRSKLIIHYLESCTKLLRGPSWVNAVIREPGSRLQECQPKLALDFGVCLTTLHCVKIKMQTKASKLSDKNFFSFLPNFLNYLFLSPALMPTSREGI